MFDMRASRRGLLQRASAFLAFLWLPFSGRKAVAEPPVDPELAVMRLLPALQYCSDLRQDNFSDLWGPDAPAQLKGIEAAIKEAGAALGHPEWRTLG